MMADADIELTCYNRGCGETFNSSNNEEDSCHHHPGMPIFHDTLKGWSCCSKMVVDFTDFLNMPGCTLSKHSNEKPPEPPKPKVDKETAHEVVEVKLPSSVNQASLERPPFNSPLSALVPSVAETLKKQSNGCQNHNLQHFTIDDDSIMIGTSCKNGGCRGTYEGPESDSEDCIYHPGVPIFHEGMKFWSCCKKRTTDFNAFLNQVGCANGLHKWKKESQSSNTVQCRWDWHQTATHVVAAVYAKEYNPTESFIKINPIRLLIKLAFPKQNGATFDLDLELRGVINVNESSAHMLGTKVEIKLRKAEAGSWVDLNFPPKKKVEETPSTEDCEGKKPGNETHVWQGNGDDDIIDLDEVEPIAHFGNVSISEVLNSNPQ